MSNCLFDAGFTRYLPLHIFIAVINYQPIHKLTTILMIYRKLDLWLTSEKGKLVLPHKDNKFPSSLDFVEKNSPSNL
jgi:hypothetical protein